MKRASTAVSIARATRLLNECESLRATSFNMCSMPTGRRCCESSSSVDASVLISGAEVSGLFRESARHQRQQPGPAERRSCASG